MTFSSSSVQKLLNQWSRIQNEHFNKNQTYRNLFRITFSKSKPSSPTDTVVAPNKIVAWFVCTLVKQEKALCSVVKSMMTIGRRFKKKRRSHCERFLFLFFLWCWRHPMKLRWCCRLRSRTIPRPASVSVVWGEASRRGWSTRPEAGWLQPQPTTRQYLAEGRSMTMLMARMMVVSHFRTPTASQMQMLQEQETFTMVDEESEAWQSRDHSMKYQTCTIYSCWYLDIEYSSCTAGCKYTTHAAPHWQRSRMIRRNWHRSSSGGRCWLHLMLYIRSYLRNKDIFDNGENLKIILICSPSDSRRGEEIFFWFCSPFLCWRQNGIRRRKFRWRGFQIPASLNSLIRSWLTPRWTSSQ